MPVHGFIKGAHHPHCPRHENHLIRIGSRPFCLGCTCLYGGLLLGSLGSALLLSQVTFSVTQLIVGLLFALLPTALQPWCQIKLFKIFSRSLLGMATGVFTIVLFTGYSLPSPKWAWRIGIVALFFVLYQALISLRRLRPSDPCVNCPQGTYPLCDWNLQHMRDATNDPELTAAIDHQLAEQPPVIVLSERASDLRVEAPGHSSRRSVA